MRNEVRHLLTPFVIGKTEFKNRFIFLPHHTGYGTDLGYRENGLCSQRVINHYVERAKGGAAAVVVSQNVDEYSQMSTRYLIGSDERNSESFRRLAEGVHQYGCKAITQLNHGGHTTLMNPPQLMLAPSQMNEPSCRFNTKELEKHELEFIKSRYVKAAKLQKDLGWDGVELKIAHDGLLRTFVSPYFNRRTDEYGGSYKNMLRYPLEVIDAIRSAVGPDYPIGIRLCLDEFTWFGYSLSYGVKLAKSLEDVGIDYINTDAGTFSSYYMEIPPSPIPLGFAIYMCAELRKHVKLPLIAFGRINDPIQAETILAENNADLIGMCRQLICDPETPNKTMEGRLDDIRHCIACNEGCIGKDGIEVECVQNPGAGREKWFGIGTLQPALEKKKVMVIGAGIAGMKVAELACKRGHDVEVYERADKVGGQVLLAEKLPYKVETAEVYRYLKIQLQEHGVPLHLNTNVDESLIDGINPDILVFATGSVPTLPDIPGLGETTLTVLDPRDAMTNVDKIGNNVLIVDNIGYWQGGGVADYVQTLGAKVTVVTPNTCVGVDIVDSMSFLLTKRLFQAGCEIIVNHSLKEFRGDAVVIENHYNHTTQTLAGLDTVIIADHSRSDNTLYKKYKARRPKVYCVGDCVAPRAIEQAIFDSEIVARKL